MRSCVRIKMVPNENLNDRIVQQRGLRESFLFAILTAIPIAKRHVNGGSRSS